MTSEQILITGIVSLSGALVFIVGLLWNYVIKPLLDEMFNLIRMMKVEQPAQTEQLRIQTGYMKAAKHASAEHLKLQKEEMEQLARIEQNQRGICRHPLPMVEDKK